MPNIESHCNYHLTSKFISFLSKRNSNLFYQNFISFFRFLENVSRQRNSYAHGDIVPSECHHNQQRLLEKCFGNFENSSTSKYWLQFIFKTLKERENQMEFFFCRSLVALFWALSFNMISYIMRLFDNIIICHRTYIPFQVEMLLFVLMVTTFLICTFCLLLSCVFSLSTGGLISKTIYVSDQASNEILVLFI